MRAFILALALTFTVGITGCQSEQADAIEDQGEAIDEAMEDQGDAIEEAYEEQADAVDEAIEDGAPAGDMEDVVGDGEIIDEPGEMEPDEM